MSCYRGAGRFAGPAMAATRRTGWEPGRWKRAEVEPVPTAAPVERRSYWGGSIR